MFVFFHFVGVNEGPARVSSAVAEIVEPSSESSKPFNFTCGIGWYFFERRSAIA